MNIKLYRDFVVTGGTGSLGSGVVKRILKEHEARRIVVISRDETRQAEMASRLANDRVKFVLADVRDPSIANFIREGDVVVHAAAMKRIEVCEQNPGLAADVNVSGTENVMKAAMMAGADRMILVSTDKSVEPSSAMGMSKALAEKIVRAGSGLVVRLCNVLGTRGSLVPMIRKQADEGSVRLTDVSMIRFFITQARAVDLIMQAVTDEHPKDLYWPEGAPACKISTMIAAICSGRGPDQKIEMVNVGKRPGERLHEKMLWVDEATPLGLSQEAYYTRVAPDLSLKAAGELLAQSDRGV